MRLRPDRSGAIVCAVGHPRRRSGAPLLPLGARRSLRGDDAAISTSRRATQRARTLASPDAGFPTRPVRLALLACIAALCVASPALAQRAAPAGVVRERAAPVVPFAHERLQIPGDSAERSRPSSRSARVLMGIGGGAIGAVAGGFAGYGIATARPCSGDCSWDGLAGAIIGIGVGSALGSATLAAVPRFDSPCDYGGRFGRGLLGGTLGLVGAVLAAELAGIFAVPIGTGIGAGIGASWCDGRRAGGST